LEGRRDRYDGIVCGVKDVEKVCVGEEEFSECVRRSLEAWRKGGVRGAWVTVPCNVESIKYTLPTLLSQGFEVHSCQKEKGRQSILLNAWLPGPVEPCRLPDAPSHTVGAGGMVIDLEARKILVVTERFAFFGKRSWKLPGGYCGRGESIKDAAVREVWEETSIRATFTGVIGVRQMHPHLFGSNDLYCVCLLSASSKTEPKAEEAEIEETIWMDLSDYVRNEEVNPYNQALGRLVLGYMEANRKVPVLTTELPMSYEHVRDQNMEEMYRRFLESKTFHVNYVIPECPAVAKI